MPIKTFINGQENGVIAFKGDTEPCSVYVNGEKQSNISYIPREENGVDFVSYKSEYKKNIRTMQIEGNTDQANGTPGIASPIPIRNAGDNGLNLVVRGTNFFDVNKIYGATNRSGTAPSAQYGTIENGVLHAKYSLNQGTQKWLDSSFIIQKAGNYGLTCEVFFDNSVKIPRVCWNLINETKGNVNVASGLRASANLTKGEWVNATLPVINVPETMVGDVVYLLLTCEGGGGQNTDVPCYIRNVSLYFENSAPYEPYFEPTTVQIPNYNIDTLYDTTLKFGRLGNYKDTLSVDRVNNKVIYTQKICRVRPFVDVGGVLADAGGTYTNHDVWDFVLTNKALYISEADTPIKCEFAKIYTNVDESDIDNFDANSICIFLSTEDDFNICFPKSLGITSKAALENYISQNGGNFGLCIEYVLKTPGTYELPKTEQFVQALLDLPTKNQTNIIEITSTPSVSSISVNYAKWEGIPNANNA